MDREPLHVLFRPVPGGRLSRAADRRLQETQIALTPEAPARSGLHGAIPQRLIPDEKRIAALIAGGAPAWAVRLKRIELLKDRTLEDLYTAWRATAWAHRRRDGAFAHAWEVRVEAWDFSLVNKLIQRHNKYFPAEANLAMDPRTSDFIGWGGREWRRQPLTMDWALAHYPPILATAMATTRVEVLD